MIDTIFNNVVAGRLRKRADEIELHLAYVRKEQADPDGSWMDCVTPEEIARDELQITDLRYAALILESGLNSNETSSK